MRTPKKNKDPVSASGRAGSVHKTKGRGRVFIPGTILVLGIVVVSFILLPILSRSSVSGGVPVLGKFGNQRIGLEDNSYFLRQVNQLGEIYAPGGLGSTQMGQIRFIWSLAFDRAVVAAGVMDTLERSGFEVSDRRVTEVLINSPSFQNGGVFDPQALEGLGRARLAKLIKEIRENITLSSFFRDVSQLYRGDQEARFILSMRGPQRRFRYLTLRFSDYPKEKRIAYGKPIAHQFRKIHLGRASLMDEGEARALLKRFEDEGADFDELAKTYSEDGFAQEGGDWGWLYTYEVRNDLSRERDFKELLALPVGKASQPFATDAGFTIFWKKEPIVEPNFDDPDEQLLEEVWDYLNEFSPEKVTEYFSEKADLLKESIKGGRTLSEVGDEQGFATHLTEFFPINFGSQRLLGDSMGEIFSQGADFWNPDKDALFFEKVFSLKKPGDVTEPLVFSDRIALFEFVEEKSAEEGEQESMTAAIKSLLLEENDDSLTQHFLSSDRFENYFNEVFPTVFSSS